MLYKYDYGLQNNFHLSSTVWFMNEQMNMSQKTKLSTLPLLNLT